MKKSIKGQITKSSEGITLIALVVTIIVLIILAGVSINALVGQNGIVTKAQEARDKYANSTVYENEQLANVEAYTLNLGSITNNGNSSEPEEVISVQESFVGCYADIDGNGTIDGVIYVDLLAGKPDDGDWGEEGYNHDFSLPTDVTTSNVKQYVKSETAVTDARFDSTPRYIIRPARNTSGTKDRFYVLALNNFTNGTDTEFYWYKSTWLGEEQGTMSDYATYTSGDFGTGKANTAAMITKWNAAGYGTKDDSDLWKWLDVGENGANRGWFVPSIGELAAFASAFNITKDNYTNYHLNDYYWTSSQQAPNAAWGTVFWLDYLYGARTDMTGLVRLSTTF